MELGIGAGWKRDEWVAYGYEFPETPERLARLGDDLEVITRMLAPGRTVHATFDGHTRASRTRSTSPSPPGSACRSSSAATGPNVTWRLAARFADEVNLDKTLPADVAKALPVIRSRCEEIGATRLAPGLGPHLAPRQGRAGPGADRPARGLPRARRRADHRIPAGLGARPGRARGPTRTTWPRPVATGTASRRQPGNPSKPQRSEGSRKEDPGDELPPSASRGLHPSPNAVQAAARGVAHRLAEPNWRRRTHVYSKATAFLSIAAVAFAACSGGGATPAASSAAPASAPAASTAPSSAASAAATACHVGVAWATFQEERYGLRDEPGAQGRRRGRWRDVHSATTPSTRPRPRRANVEALISAGRQRPRRRRPGSAGDPAVDPEGGRRRHPGHRL